MDKHYLENEKFEGIDFTAKVFEQGHYENCSFTTCNFSGINLSGIIFENCSFNDCNLGMALLGKTAFRDCRFTGCKLLGLHFEHCNEIGLEFHFDHCTLDLSSFYKLKIKQTVLKHCIMHEVDLTETDLTAAIFDHCDLAGAVFDRSILEKADLRTSYNYTINPEINKIKKAKFSKEGLAGLLSKYDIVIE
ncbi:pentapeptide repeat-containing protein [Ferruginibacter sp.]